MKHKFIATALEGHIHLQSIIIRIQYHSIRQNWIVRSKKGVSVSHLTAIPLLLRCPQASTCQINSPTNWDLNSQIPNWATS